MNLGNVIVATQSLHLKVNEFAGGGCRTQPLR
jgi:hypothetical protein